MHDEHLGAAMGHGAHKVGELRVALLLINTNAVFDGHWHVAGIAHGSDAVADQLRFSHQAGAKAATLHTIRGATTVQVDFVVAPIGAELGAGGEVRG